jgi:ABC-2 type transport system permease protein
MLLDPGARRYWINEESPKGYPGAGAARHGRRFPAFSKQTVSGRAIRYVDWVMPGVLAMNMMFSCLFGVGYVIVRYRKNGMLKRLKATPLTPLEFLAAQVTSRLWLTLFRPRCWYLSVPTSSSASLCLVPMSPCSWFLRSARLV